MDEYIKVKRKEKIKIITIQFVILIGFIFLWEITANLKLIDSFLFSQPSKIYQVFMIYMKNGELFRHVFISLFETLVGLFIGTFGGFILAVLLWYYPCLQKIFSPFLVVFNAKI